MAYDRDTKLKIRAYYESHDESLAKVAVHFQSMKYDVSQKTIEYWASNKEQEMGKWEKNRYDSLKTAVEKLLPEAVLKAANENVHETIIAGVKEQGGETLTPEVLDTMSDEVGEVLVYEVLGKHSLMGMMATNLKAAETIAKVSPSIGVKATFHQMVVGAIQTTYGKKIDLVPQDPNNKILDDKALDAKTTEELLEMME